MPKKSVVTPTLRDWNNQIIPTNPNPCIPLHGKGPDGATCQNCVQFVGICKAKTYYKCMVRKNTHGSATDHKRAWAACGKFEQREAGKDIQLYDGR